MNATTTASTTPATAVQDVTVLAAQVALGCQCGTCDTCLAVLDAATAPTVGRICTPEEAAGFDAAYQAAYDAEQASLRGSGEYAAGTRFAATDVDAAVQSLHDVGIALPDDVMATVVHVTAGPRGRKLLLLDYMQAVNSLATRTAYVATLAEHGSCESYLESVGVAYDREADTAKVYPAPTAEHAAMDLAWHGPGTDCGLEAADCDGSFVASFHHDTGYLPRCEAELTAYANSAAEWAAYLAANPVTTTTAPTTTPLLEQVLNATAKPVSPELAAHQAQQAAYWAKKQAADAAKAAAAAALTALNANQPTSPLDPGAAQRLIDAAKAAADQAKREAHAAKMAESARAAGTKAGKLLYGADLKVMSARYNAGRIVQQELVKQRREETSAGAWRKQRASVCDSMEAAIIRESGASATVTELVGCYMAVQRLSVLSGLVPALAADATPEAALAHATAAATAWCRKVTFSVSREMIPLVSRDSDTEDWQAVEGVADELAALLAVVTGPVPMSAAWTRTKVLEVSGTALSRRSAAAAEVAKAITGTTPEDIAAKAALDKQAVDDAKRAADKLTKAANAQQKQADKQAAKDKPAPTQPTTTTITPTPAAKPATDALLEFETTLENMGGFGKGLPAAASVRAQHAWTLLGYGTSGMQAFATKLVTEDLVERDINPAAAATTGLATLLAELTRLNPAHVRAVVERAFRLAAEQEAAKPAAK